MMRKATFLFIEAQGRATRRVLLEALAFRAVFGRLPRPDERRGGGGRTPDAEGTRNRMDAKDIRTDAGNICADAGSVRTDAKDIRTDAGNICADAGSVRTDAKDIRAEGADTGAGVEVEGLRARHVAMLRLILAYERAADEAEAALPRPADGTHAHTDGDGGWTRREEGATREEEKRRKERDKENAPSPRTPLTLKEKDKEKESEKKETPAREATPEEKTGKATPASPCAARGDGAHATPPPADPQPCLFGEDSATPPAQTTPDGGHALAGKAADTPPAAAASAKPARRRAGRKAAAKAAARLTRDQTADGESLARALPFVDPRHADALARWLRYKRERGQEYRSEESLRTCYEHFLALCHDDPDTGRGIVERSVANNWSGLFAPDSEKNNQRFMTYDEQRELDRQRRERQAGELVRHLLDTNRPYDPDEDRRGLDLSDFGFSDEGV